MKRGKKDDNNLRASILVLVAFLVVGFVILVSYSGSERSYVEREGELGSLGFLDQILGSPPAEDANEDNDFNLFDFWDWFFGDDTINCEDSIECNDCLKEIGFTDFPDYKGCRTEQKDRDGRLTSVSITADRDESGVVNDGGEYEGYTKTVTGEGTVSYDRDYNDFGFEDTYDTSSIIDELTKLEKNIEGVAAQDGTYDKTDDEVNTHEVFSLMDNGGLFWELSYRYIDRHKKTLDEDDELIKERHSVSDLHDVIDNGALTGNKEGKEEFIEVTYAREGLSSFIEYTDLHYIMEEVDSSSDEHHPLREVEVKRESIRLPGGTVPTPDPFLEGGVPRPVPPPGVAPSPPVSELAVALVDGDHEDDTMLKYQDSIKVTTNIGTEEEFKEKLESYGYTVEMDFETNDLISEAWHSALNIKRHADAPIEPGDSVVVQVDKKYHEDSDGSLKQQHVYLSRDNDLIEFIFDYSESGELSSVKIEESVPVVIEIGAGGETIFEWSYERGYIKGNKGIYESKVIEFEDVYFGMATEFQPVDLIYIYFEGPELPYIAFPFADLSGMFSFSDSDNDGISDDRDTNNLENPFDP